MYCFSLSIAAHVARFVHLWRTRTCSATGSLSFVQFQGSPRGEGRSPVECKKREVRMVLPDLRRLLS